MNDLALFSSPAQTMSSREVADLTGKRHDNVLRDIDRLVKEVSSDLRNGFKSTTYKDASSGREYRMYVMDRDSTYCLVAGYDATARMRIIKRWQELEAGQKPQALDLAAMLPEALRLLANKTEECLALNARIVTMQPKADFYDHVAGSEALFDRADAAKMLRTGPRRLWTALREWKVVQASGAPYQKYFDQGIFRLVPVLVHKGQYSIPYQQTLITGKGLAWIKAMMDSQVLPAKAIRAEGAAQ